VESALEVEQSVFIGLVYSTVSYPSGCDLPEFPPDRPAPMEIVLHYYHHHIGDFLKATSRLTDAQSMAYLRLLWMYYDSEKPLPNDLEVLAFQVGTDTKTVELILLSFFKPDDTGPEMVWMHTRCDKEIREYRKLIHKKSTAGKASAERRSNSSSTGVEQVSSTDPADVQLTNNQEPVTSNDIKDKSARKRAVDKPEEVTQKTWDAFLLHRKTKRATVTDVVLEKLSSEARKAGISLDEAMREMCARGWVGFNADWMQKSAIEKNIERKERADAAMRVITGQQRSITGDYIDVIEDKDDPFRISFGG
jgi:uncharacterized protein YdaU (DUF1376 family)